MTGQDLPDISCVAPPPHAPHPPSPTHNDPQQTTGQGGLAESKAGESMSVSLQAPGSWVSWVMNVLVCACMCCVDVV